MSREPGNSWHESCVLFQAEDGIRNIGVTGVQTCALPISVIVSSLLVPLTPSVLVLTRSIGAPLAPSTSGCPSSRAPSIVTVTPVAPRSKSKPDRKSAAQGQSVELGGRRIIKKKHHPAYSV